MQATIKTGLCKRNICNRKISRHYFKTIRRSSVSTAPSFHAVITRASPPPSRGAGMKASELFGLGSIIGHYGANRSGFAPGWRQFICLAPALTMFGANKLEKSTANSTPDQFLQRGVKR